MVRVVWRLFGIFLLLVSVIFFEALLLELGREGGLRALPTAVPSAVGFTVNYLQGMAHGDLGLIASSYRTLPGKPVAAELARALPISMGLLAAALAFAVVIGLLLGTAAALQKARRSSGLILFASAVGFSTPSFFAAMLLIWLAVWLYRTTGRHVLPISGVGWDAHIILPALVLAARPAATVTRLCCNAIAEVLETDYVRTAISKGLRPRLVFLRHVLRNAGVPILTTIGVSIRFGLAALPIVEYIFNWPGIGSGLLKAVQAQDTTAVVGMSLPLVLFFVLVNLLLDLFYPLVDPRLRASKGA
jgi:peptide/nickel transport system permease protein